MSSLRQRGEKAVSGSARVCEDDGRPAPASSTLSRISRVMSMASPLTTLPRPSSTRMTAAPSAMSMRCCSLLSQPYWLVSLVPSSLLSSSESYGTTWSHDELAAECEKAWLQREPPIEGDVADDSREGWPVPVRPAGWAREGDGVLKPRPTTVGDGSGWLGEDVAEGDGSPGTPLVEG